MKQTEKIYAVQNVLSKKYFNAPNKYFTNEMYLASISKEKKKCEKLIDIFKLKECEIVEILEKDFMESLASMTTEIVIISESLATKLDAIRDTIPTLNSFTKELKQNIRTTSKKIKKATGHLFEDFTNQKEDATFDVLGEYEDFIRVISQLKMWHITDAKESVLALLKNPDKVKKVNNEILSKNP